MKTKILLIDDRTPRQQKFVNEIQLDLNDYKEILENCIDEKYDDLYKKLKSDEYDLNIYDVIITHENAFGKDNSIILSKLERYCKNKSKSLVIFSGGIDTSNYQQYDKYEILKINSKILYSENLKLFLEECKTNKQELLILNYGNQWKLNILLNILEKINYFISTNDAEMVYFEDFIDECKIKLIEPLNLNIYTIEEDMEVNISEIIKLRDNILNVIKEMADE